MRALAFALAAAAALALVACGDNGKPSSTEDAAVAIDGALPVDAAIDAPPAVVGPCLERPTDLPRPPTGALPCDLLPPGFAP